MTDIGRSIMMTRGYDDDDDGLEFMFTFDLGASGDSADYPLRVDYSDEIVIVYRNIRQDSDDEGLSYNYTCEEECSTDYGSRKEKSFLKAIMPKIVGFMEEFITAFNTGCMNEDYYGVYYPRTIPERGD